MSPFRHSVTKMSSGDRLVCMGLIELLKDFLIQDYYQEEEVDNEEEEDG